MSLSSCLSLFLDFHHILMQITGIISSIQRISSLLERKSVDLVNSSYEFQQKFKSIINFPGMSDSIPKEETLPDTNEDNPDAFPLSLKFLERLKAVKDRNQRLRTYLYLSKFVSYLCITIHGKETLPKVEKGKRLQILGFMDFRFKGSRITEPRVQDSRL